MDPSLSQEIRLAPHNIGLVYMINVRRASVSIHAVSGFDGKGTLTYKNGSNYSGSWENDVKEGQGK